MKRQFLFKITSMIAMGWLVSSCGPTLTPFTKRLYEEQKWSETDLKRIQFYLSHDVVLRRETSGSSSDIVSGEIKIVGGKRVEEVVVRKGTPGVFLFSPKESRFAITFDSSTDENYLMFGPNPRASNQFVLLASDWDRRQGTITYGGKTYNVDSSSAFSGLMVDLKRSQRISVNSKTAGGRKVE